MDPSAQAERNSETARAKPPIAAREPGSASQGDRNPQDRQRAVGRPERDTERATCGKSEREQEGGHPPGFATRPALVATLPDPDG